MTVATQWQQAGQKVLDQLACSYDSAIQGDIGGTVRLCFTSLRAYEPLRAYEGCLRGGFIAVHIYINSALAGPFAQQQRLSFTRFAPYLFGCSFVVRRIQQKDFLYLYKQRFGRTICAKTETLISIQLTLAICYRRCYLAGRANISMILRGSQNFLE